MPLLFLSLIKCFSMFSDNDSREALIVFLKDSPDLSNSMSLPANVLESFKIAFHRKYHLFPPPPPESGQ